MFADYRRTSQSMQDIQVCGQNEVCGLQAEIVVLIQNCCGYALEFEWTHAGYNIDVDV